MGGRDMMRLWVAETLRQAVLRSNLHDTPAGQRMVMACREPEDFNERGFHPVVALRADPDAWDALLGWLTVRSTAHVGDSRDLRKRAARAKRQAERISKALSQLANHPAYRDLMIAANDATVLPAAQKPGDDRWWPTERMALASPQGDPERLTTATLEPHYSLVRGQGFTRWQPSSPATRDLAASRSNRPSSAPGARRAAPRPSSS